MKSFFRAILALCALTATPAMAQDSPVVVELFTSQGCSSCPPADALLIELSERRDVIALALHVDYWDYIGWKDEYARPENTRRQRAYAHFAGRNMIYTPQMIVNGQDDVVGARAMELVELIEKHKSRAPGAVLQTTRSAGVLMIHAEPAGPLTGPLTVHLVRFTPRKTAHITRGENAGRELEYANVVDDWTVVGSWDGQQPLDIRTALDGDRPAAVLIQTPGPGEIVAAALSR